MKAELIKKEGNKVTLKITVDNNKFEAAVNKAYNKSKSKYNIPGFRKGKAPRIVIETQYGKGIFYNDAIEVLFPEVYPEAIKELDIDPIDNPDLDIEEISKDNGLVMVLNVEVKPEFELGNYKGIEVAKVENTVSDENVEAKLQEMVEKNARLVSVEDKALEDGDTAIIDFEGFDNGVAFDGGKGENYNLVIGSNTFIPGFEEQLVGKKAGEEVEVNVTFPEEYHSEDLAGKPVVFNVKVNDVKVKELSVLDDEFAKDTSEFDTLDELKADVRAKLEEEAKNKADAEIRNSVVEKVAENTEIEIPEVMVEHQIDNMLNELNYQLQYQGFGLQQLLEMTGRTMEELREERKEDAKKLVKSSLVLEAITKAEGIEATEEEFKAELEKMASAYNMEVEKIETTLRDADKEDIKGQIKIRKTIDLLVESATIA
ncbi:MULTISPECIES: trigger factor [unclassified Clostridioides]|uniref:trigger factor n=1 Tax=unclassified Clostridioides TaxID=2635829 RepID=UPI001D0C99B4|nr:trigger factor [Clostridioides sp. ES-S-0049-03]MCC0656216.1 trigger factor [Clostridioides sp. ES-S-0123-01]MCC0671467.1 trigger factor [Clostridioides sp. ES-S-0145-01]MCC0678321.1 trigger factor [Clostridioides sp. ES-W-0018-02]MCC0704737.1 trigger factor [Clostridioides sp. ES-S-0049-02]MCC0707996.1 trigger factor [Clostridioides sp. ES-S-0190-01]MCC0713201.1 trigger factor [Clostridioides sp. ES-W-0017-02]MCC0764245.1 trigger factor [Clostridioides sp. ES-S-0006-03]UDN58834.1 trigge